MIVRARGVLSVHICVFKRTLSGVCSDRVCLPLGMSSDQVRRVRCSDQANSLQANGSDRVCSPALGRVQIK